MPVKMSGTVDERKGNVKVLGNFENGGNIFGGKGTLDGAVSLEDSLFLIFNALANNLLRKWSACYKCRFSECMDD